MQERALRWESHWRSTHVSSCYRPTATFGAHRVDVTQTRVTTRNKQLQIPIANQKQGRFTREDISQLNITHVRKASGEVPGCRLVCLTDIVHCI